MIKYDRTDISEQIDVNKTNKSKECKFCHYWHFLNKNFSYGPYALLLFILEKIHTEFIFNM